MSQKFSKVLAFEGEWGFALRTKKKEGGVLKDNTSMRTILETLKQRWGADEFDFIHKKAATIEELDFYLKRALGKKQELELRKYDVLIFDFHGDPEGNIWINEDWWINLADLGKYLEEDLELGETCLRDKVVIFGSCYIAQNFESIKAFKKETGALAVVAFTEYVNWVEGAAFYLLLLEWLREHQYLKTVKKKIEERYPTFSEHLGMHFEI